MMKVRFSEILAVGLLSGKIKGEDPYWKDLL